jgi:hypothetical protein
MQLVKFKGAFGAYRPGETAGFSEDEAARLVTKLEIAEFCEEVRFRKPHGSRKAGDRAFVGTEEAEQLVDEKVAERIKPGKDKVSSEPQSSGLTGQPAKPGEGS